MILVYLLNPYYVVLILPQCGNEVQQMEIEASYQRRDKVYSFSTTQHQYRLDFNYPMYQQNMNPKFFTTRDVKRRPLFCSGEEVMKNKR